MQKRHVVILMHENDNESTTKAYLIYTLAQLWREEGHKVTFLYGTKKFIPADIIFVHVDLSVVPDSYLEVAKRYPVSINGSIKDIRKKSYSNHLLGRNDSWDGPVVVKSNNNSAGIPERRRRGFPGRIQKKVSFLIKQSSIPFLPSPILSAQDYKVYDHLGEVPSLYFIHPGVIVQKFLPERDGNLYCTRILVFLGDKTRCSLVKSPGPIVNSNNAEIIEYDVEPHPEILALQKKLGFDYGKFDYVMNDGNVILLDANKTVGSPRELVGDSKLRRRMKFYAKGLDSFF